MELIQELTQQLGINPQQASGGVGLLLGMAKNKLGGDFRQVEQHVPEAENLINSAPHPSPAAGAAQGSGLMGAIGGLMGGNNALGSLAGGFQQLGMSPNLIGRFLPIVLNFFQTKGGAPVRGLVERALAA